MHLAASSLPQFNEEAMAQLQAMGFPTIRCQKALLASGNSDPEVAMEWLFEHMEDPGEYRVISKQLAQCFLKIVTRY